MSQRYPMPMPFGWYAVSYADELAPGESRAVRYFNQDLVLFRTESGTPVLLEAYCPHLGACLLYTSPSPRDRTRSRMPSSA